MIGLAGVQRLAIDIGKDRHRFDAHLAAAADEAHRNLAAVGDQDSLEHRETSEGAEIMILLYESCLGRGYVTTACDVDYLSVGFGFQRGSREGSIPIDCISARAAW